MLSLSGDSKMTKWCMLERIIRKSGHNLLGKMMEKIQQPTIDVRIPKRNFSTFNITVLYYVNYFSKENMENRCPAKAKDINLQIFGTCRLH